LYINNSTSDKTGALIYGEFDNKLLRINGTLNLVGSGTYTGSWTAASDRRLKENIVDLKSTLEKTLSLRPVSYDWKDPEQAKNQGHQIGLIAQDVEDLFPELVKTDVNGMKSMDYSRLSVILIQAFKEQEQVIVNQQSKIDKQEQIVSSLVEENKSIRQELQGLQQLKNELNKLREEVTFSSAK